MSSPGSATTPPIAPTVGETKDTTSSAVGCFIILYDFAALFTSQDIVKGTFAFVLPLATVTVASTREDALIKSVTAFGEKGDIVKVKFVY